MRLRKCYAAIDGDLQMGILLGRKARDRLLVAATPAARSHATGFLARRNAHLALDTLLRKLADAFCDFLSCHLASIV